MAAIATPHGDKNEGKRNQESQRSRARATGTQKTPIWRGKEDKEEEEEEEKQHVSLLRSYC